VNRGENQFGLLELHALAIELGSHEGTFCGKPGLIRVLDRRTCPGGP